jgi:hypothetical protein
MGIELRFVVQLAIGIVFLLSAIAKARNPRTFAQGVMEYGILPRSVAYFVGLVLLPLEALLAVSHLTGWQLDVVLPLGLLMLLSFGLAVGINLRRGRVLPCYCFGSGAREGEMISARTLARLVLLFSAEALLLIEGNRLTIRQPAAYSWQAGGLLKLSLALFWASFVLLTSSWLLSSFDILNLLRAVEHPPSVGQRPPDALLMKSENLSLI